MTDRTNAEPIRFGIYGLDPARVALLAEAWNAIAAGRRVEILPADRDAEHAVSPGGRLSAEIEADATESRRAKALASGLPQAGDMVRSREDPAALSLA